jgi:predicted nuclease of restriction endonuclease-like (RecB) superfamily
MEPQRPHPSDRQQPVRPSRQRTHQLLADLPAEQSELAQEILKDPYSFDFLSLGPEMLERDLERGLIEHLRSLILELGKGFAFVGSQYHLEVGGQDYYLDLLFYHLRLRCFVVIELKIEDFKPEFAGKMNFYLSAVDDQLRHKDDRPTIGIILCKGRNEVIVEYALRDTSKPIGVAQYKLSPALPPQLARDLPTVEEFAREFPLMSVVKLRIEIERAVRDIMRETAFLLDHPLGSVTCWASCIAAASRPKVPPSFLTLYES